MEASDICLSAENTECGSLKKPKFGVFSRILDFLVGCLLGVRKRKWI